jgi:hypothetical protein
MTKLTVTTSALALVVMLGACEGTRYALPYEPHPSYGAVMAQNLETMVVDPEPAYAQLGAPDFHGKRAFLAIDRYEKGTVIEPVPLRVTGEATGG